MAAPEPPQLREEDLGSSATANALPRLDALVDRIRHEAGGRPFRRLVDLGCGYGGLTERIGKKLAIDDLVGIDADPGRLEVASGRGIRTFVVDLNDQPLPVEDGSTSLVTSFGVLEYMVRYDNFITEAHRVLEPGGFLLVSMPNLGSYSNRIALLLGYQPRDVEISKAGRLYGMLPFYGTHTTKPPHVHSATLRCMRDMLEDSGFRLVQVRSIAPEFGGRAIRLVDRMIDRFPSITRRFALVATKS